MKGDAILNSSLIAKQRIDLIKTCFILNNISIISEKDEFEYFHTFDVFFCGLNISLNLFIKNITNSGWAEKPYIKRIQVPSLLGKAVPKNTLESLSIFIGIGFVNDKPILVAWNPFSYVYHKTNRSCYVNVESLDNAYHMGLYKTVDSNKKIILARNDCFGDLIKVYLEDNVL